MSTSRYTMEDFDILQLAAVDINGILRGEETPKSVGRHVLDKGIDIYQYISCLGINEDFPFDIEEIMGSTFNNGEFVPDKSTLTAVPWLSTPHRRIGLVLGSVVQENGMPEPSDVRYQVKRQLQRLSIEGLNLTSCFSCQFRATEKSSNGKVGLGYDVRGGMSIYGNLLAETTMFSLCEDLSLADVGIESWSADSDKGAFTLYELPSEGIGSADMTCRLKFGVKSCLMKLGYDVTFMSRPESPRDESSSFVFKFKLRTLGGMNVLSKADDPDGVSELARHWIAGMIEHGPALAALCRPTYVCYPPTTRLTDTEYFSWAVDDPTSFINLKISGDDVWIENRLPSSACNPYFVMLSTIASGLDGFERKLSCPPKNSPSSVAVPQSFREAVEALEKDDVIKREMSGLLSKAFRALKTKTEIEKFEEFEKKNETEEKKREFRRNMYFVSS